MYCRKFAQWIHDSGLIDMGFGETLLGKEVVSRRDWIELSLSVILNVDFNI